MGSDGHLFPSERLSPLLPPLPPPPSPPLSECECECESINLSLRKGGDRLRGGEVAEGKERVDTSNRGLEEGENEVF